MYTTAMITISRADAMIITKTNGTTTAAMFRSLLPFDGGNDEEKTENITSTCNNVTVT